MTFLIKQGNQYLSADCSKVSKKPKVKGIYGMPSPCTVHEFIECHRPDSLDLDYIERNFGIVETYMRASATDGDDGGWYIEVPGSDTKSGNPVIIEWA